MSPKLLNLLLVILPCVVYFGYLEPAYTGEGGFVWTPEKSIKVLQAENIQYANTLGQIEIIRQAGEKLYKDFQAVDKEVIKNISVMLPDSIDQVRLRNEVLQIGARNGIAIEGLKVERDTRGEGNLGVYRVTFSMKARYLAFKDFMRVFEKNKRFFILEKASISRPKVDKNDPLAKELDDTILNINLTFKVYHLK